MKKIIALLLMAMVVTNAYAQYDDIYGETKAQTTKKTSNKKKSSTTIRTENDIRAFVASIANCDPNGIIFEKRFGRGLGHLDGYTVITGSCGRNLTKGKKAVSVICYYYRTMKMNLFSCEKELCYELNIAATYDDGVRVVIKEDCFYVPTVTGVKYPEITNDVVDVVYYYRNGNITKTYNSMVAYAELTFYDGHKEIRECDIFNWEVKEYSHPLD